MRFLLGLILVVMVLTAMPSVSEARCGGRGFRNRPHRLRNWFHNHRPHVFHHRCG